jgi:hypothetical protein
MKLKVITTVSNNNHPLLQKLEESLKIGEYDYHIVHNPSIGWDWGGWANAYDYNRNVLEPQGYTHMIYTDGFDTLALGTYKEAQETLERMLGDNQDGMIYSVEKHWFPHEGTDVAPKDWQVYHAQFQEKTKDLPPNYHWRHVNGGQYAGSLSALRWWYENAPKQRNNQAYANAYYSEQTDDRLMLDFRCELFQTLSHSGPNHGSPEEFTIKDKRLINNHTGSKPVFVHNNGIKNPTEAQFMYNILGL